ncbi:MAG: hypothetical protein ACE5JC_11465, partial [Candidatus Zixiibacteriota bacterium]
RQITSPVLWYPSLRKMVELGVNIFIEVGPGKVLQGLVKRSFPPVGDEPLSEEKSRALGVDKSEDLEVLEQSLQK